MMAVVESPNPPLHLILGSYRSQAFPHQARSVEQRDCSMGVHHSRRRLSGGTVSSTSIKTIFWDIGGVLLTNGWDKGQQTRVLSRLGVDLADYESRHDAANYFWERGLSDARTFFNKTVFHAEAQSTTSPSKTSGPSSAPKTTSSTRSVSTSLANSSPHATASSPLSTTRAASSTPTVWTPFTSVRTSITSSAPAMSTR